MARNRGHAVRVLALAGACGFATVCGAAQKPITGPDTQVIVIGTLSCSLTGEGEGAPAGTSVGLARDVLCRFQPGQLGPEETYVGSVQGVGQAKLLFGRGAVLLAV